LTLEDLAAQFRVSRERIRQIEVRAFEKVRKAAKNLAAQAPAAMMQLGAPEPRSDHAVWRSAAHYPCRGHAG
jgi:hypothetical protein